MCVYLWRIFKGDEVTCAQGKEKTWKKKQEQQTMTKGEEKQ